ncbi:MAG: UDP-N-acetylmuramoyl-tripeptide--D-alanyl-D-alanine ligase [Gallionella sp.]|jgi:UDP-N-acetylmuramoyl-tripeptide--D-alanyl-D-alanine ligase
MMQLAKAAKVLGARLVSASQAKELRFVSVSTDTRKVVQGDLYIALRGEHFDGADFIAQAAASGAVAAIVNQDAGSRIQDAAIPLLLVEDTRLALGQLAAHWRRQFDIPVVGITGSNGKTTVKEMLASILRVAAGSDEAVLATKGNFNNDIGMPLTLLQLNAQHRYAVIEMGMNHPGEIDYLTRIACPQVALINNASGAHLEGMGSVEAVAHAKGEIFAGLQHEGSAIINADDEFAPLWRSLAGVHSLLEFGLNPAADVSGVWYPQTTGLRLMARTPSGDFTADLQVPGEHNARNALAATAAAIELNLSLESIVEGLEKFGGVAGRLQRKAARGGAVVIDDTYNANPASLNAAIAVLAQTNGHRVLVLGDMGELGENAAAFHAGIGKSAKQSGIEKLYALGELSREAVREFGVKAQHFDGIDALLAALEVELHAGTTVLVKGSRFMKMERVVAFCVATDKE